jgi:hypothetical protein
LIWGSKRKLQIKFFINQPILAVKYKCNKIGLIHKIMQKLLFGLIATVMFIFVGNAQTSKKDWFKMMENSKFQIDKLLTKECPSGMPLNEFKNALIMGKNALSSNAQRSITQIYEPLRLYGEAFAIKHNLELRDESSLLFYSSLEPDTPMGDGAIIVAVNSTPGLTWAEVGNCALFAIGADALYSLAFSGASSWGVAAMTQAFTSVAKRFLGPIGVAIAVVSFGLCIAEQSTD